MAGGKRASMREGPLAALFRGTTDLEAEDRAERERRERETAEAEARAAAAWRAPREEPEAVEPEPHVPSPQERLRAAFSADLPENVMAPPPPQAPPPPDPYARSPEAPSFEPRPMSGPVIRVIGVGGAGVNAVNRMIEAEVVG